MSAGRIPPQSVLAACFDAAATVLEFADREPTVVALLPEPMRAFIAAAEPACRAMFSSEAQLQLFPGAPVVPAGKGVRRGR